MGKEKKKELSETQPAVTVKMSKLTEGVGILFSGILTMLEALDPETAGELVERFVHRETVTAPDAAVEEEKTDENANPGAADDASADTAPDNDAASDEVNSHAAEEPGSSVTADDITKIIVQKIKQNRGNNEKIGAILKTYGVAKVSELPPSKYEAFLTDVAAI